jgi:sugar lactone lactonase YvrE
VGSVTSAPAKLTVDQGSLPVSIVREPTVQKVFPGASATFNVGVVGTPPLTYQWRKGGVALVGATAASYTIDSVAPSDLGAYSVQVGGAEGGPVSSADAVLSFDLTPPAGGTWSVLAGAAGGAGSLDATGAAAQFNYPRGLALDSELNLYVADTQNHTIRKITPAGVTTTFAGSAGSRGDENGLPLQSRFREPQGVAIAAGSNLYVADTGNHVIRKISASGVVSTLAGTLGKAGALDGAGLGARFNQPTRLAVGAAGDLFVTDTGNHTIRRITAEGVVSTFAGAPGLAGGTDATASSARFNSPGDLAFDAVGNLYVADTGNKTIRKITAGGTVTTVAGRAGFYGINDGTREAARFGSPTALTSDANGNLWVLDGHRLRAVTSSGEVTTVAGSLLPGANNGTGNGAEFFNPLAVCRAPTGDFYIADTGNSVVRVVSPGAVVATFAGTASSGNVDGTATNARFHSPRGAALDAAGNVYIADAGNHTIRRVTLSGVATTFAGSGAPGSLDGKGTEAQFNAPQSVAADAAGNVYVADTGNHVLRVISPDGLVTTLAGSAGFKGSLDGTGNDARFSQPRGVALDAAGNIYVSDAGNFTVRKVTPAGVVSTLAGSAGVSGSADGTGAAARLGGPGALTWESSGNLLLVDANAIRRVSPGGVVSTVAGRPGGPGALDGAISLASFSAPQGLAVDAAGTIFVADTFNHTIRKIATDGTVSTLAGAAGDSGSVDGFGTAVRFAYPSGLCVDSLGNLVVTDLDNSKVRLGLLRDTPLRLLSEPSDSKVFTGDSVTLSVSASGLGPLSYQWRKNGVDLPGATSPEYTIASFQTADAGGYSALVANLSGTLTSATATVSLRTEAPTPVTLTTAPRSVVAATGYAAVFTVEAEGSAPLRYQWRKDGVNIIGATSASYTIRAAAPADVGSYSVLVFNSGSSVESAPVTLTVNDVGNAPPVIIKQPVSLIRYPGVPGIFTVGVTGAPPLQFQWRKGGVAIAGGTASTLLVGGMPALAAGSYDVVVSNGLETSPVISSKAALTFTNSPPASGMWTTIAGAPGGPGASDGSALDARLSAPQGVALRSLGGALYEVYLADTRNHTIRKISSGGEVTTFAGTPGVSGAVNGVGALARFNAPQSVAVDAAGNVYVADTGNHVVRKITPDGVVSTLAGFPTYFGKADGQGTAARFNFPVALASDPSGNLYVADRENHAIRLISTEGFVTTPAGYPGNPGSADGFGLVARFNRPGGVAVRSLGGDAYEVFIADTGNKLLRKMTTTGDVTTVAGAAGFAGNTDGAAAAVRFGNPTGLACAADSKVYIADGNRIRVLDLTNGSVAPFAGGLAAGREDSSLEYSSFNGPQGLALSPVGEVLVADTGNSTLRRINVGTDTVDTLAGAASAGSDNGIGLAAQFRTPGAAVLDANGNLYVADAGNHTIRKVTISGVATTLAGAPGSPGFLDGTGAAARFSTPRGLVLDPAGNLYVADSGNHVIRVISPAGHVTTFAGIAGLPGSLDGTRETARFSLPRGLALDAQGNLYVADTFNFSIRKVTPTGLVTTLAGSPGTAGTANGLGGAARFSSPVALALDAAGNLYVADLHAIRRVTPAGLVSTFVGDPVLSGSLDGVGTAAGFASPQALALDPAGNLYVADTGNQLVRRVSSSGNVTTVAGSAGWPGSGEGVGTGVRFASPSGVAADALGNLYVVDAESAKVRVGILAATPLRLVSEPADTTTFLNRTTLFQVSATGPAPLAYQWSKDGSPIPEATEPAYRIPATSTAAAGTYSVTVTNPMGTVTSRNAVLTVDSEVPTPVLITASPADLSVVLGASGTLSVTATGSGTLSYQWRKNNAPIPGATTSQLLFAAVTLADDASYDVVVTNRDGPVSSVPARLTVTAPSPGAPLIASQTTAQKVSPGAGATFEVTPTGTGPFTYQWRKNSVAIPGATASSYTLGTVYATDVGSYEVVVSNVTGSSTSQPAELTLNLVPPASGLWSTLAGPLGGPGSLDAAEPANAQFNYPRGLALAAVGTLYTVYVADAGNHTIRKISPSGVVSTVAGAPGLSGSANGAAVLARFNAPSGVALDSEGNLYVADTGNHLIRKIDTTGEVSTFAGTSNKPGTQDGAAAVARFNGPQALVVTASGTLYVADTGNSVIRRITSGGSVTTFAGNASFVGYRDAISGLAQFNKPAGLALDGAGNLYVADTGNKVIRKIAPDASVTTVAGAANFVGTADGAGTLARFTNPVALVSDMDGNLLVLDANRVRSVSSAGLVATLAGNSAAGFAEGTGAGAQFSGPLGLVSVGTAGAYIADTGNSVIREITSDGTVTTFAGTPSAGAVDSDLPNSVRFRAPRGLAQDVLGNLYVADSANHTIRKVTNSGATTTLAGEFGIAGNSDGEALSARFNAPQAVALDAAGNVYVADTGNHVVRVISTAGVVSTFAGTPGLSGRADGAGADARFLSPRGIALDTKGDVYVADTGNLTIRKITAAGVVTTLAGAPGASGSLDGAGGSARFTSPVALAVNASGNIVVADGSAIRAVSPFGNVTTLAGVAGVRGAADGTGANALFASPQGVALDTAGNVYVADTYNQTIRKVSASGAVTTLAGAVGMTGSAEGIGSVARFAYPAGILVDALGNLVVTEWDSAKVRLGTLVDTSLLIRTQPANVSALVGTRVLLSVVAGGIAPFSYQWRRNGADIDGATLPSLVLTSALELDSGVYDVVVSNAAGSLQSAQATLSVRPPADVPPSITRQPANAAVLPGNPVTLSVTAEGTAPLTYQWRKGGVPITGATSATLQLSSPQTADSGTYDVQVSNRLGTLTSEAAVLTVSLTPIVVAAITVQPVSVLVTVGSSATLSVVASGSNPLSYEWRKDGVPLAAGNTASFVLPSAQLGDAGSYDVIVSNAGGKTTSNAAALTVNPVVPTAPKITSQPLAQATYEGISATFRVSVTGTAPFTYQWRRGGTPIAGGTSASYSIASASAGDAATYDVVVSNAVGNVTSSVVALTLRTLPASGAGNWSTLAGSPGGAGAVDARGADARLNYPTGIAVDRGSGIVYFSDSQSNTIRKLAPDGTLSTLAGTPGLRGTADGRGSAARFWKPHGIALSADGNLLVADSNNHSIRKVTPDGVVSTFAGSTTASGGTLDGIGTAARFKYPRGLAFDRAGNLFVADSHNSAVRKITPAGVVSTYAGIPGDPTLLGTYTIDVRVDSQNNVYVTSDSSTKKVSPSGVITGVAGYSQARGIALDGAGNLWATTVSHLLRKVAPDGTVSIVAGSSIPSSEDGQGTAASFRSPGHCDFDAAGNLLIADTGNNLLRKVSPSGAVTTLLGTGCFGNADGFGSAARFRTPSHIARDSSGNLYVTDTDNHTIRKITPAGLVSTLAGTPGVSGNVDGPANTATFNKPVGIALDSAGNIYVADTSNNRIRKISGGQVSHFAGPTDKTSGFENGAAAAARFRTLVGLAVDTSGNVFVGDTGNSAVRKITPNGDVSTFAGGTVGTADGTGTAAQFDTPRFLAFDAAGNLLVADGRTGRTDPNNVFPDAIRKITPAGEVTTFPNGAGSLAGFGVAADGTIYGTDGYYSLIRKFPTSGSAAVLAGKSEFNGSTDGPSSGALFNSPNGLLVQPDGSLVVVDQGNGRIRVCTLADISLSVTSAPSARSVSVGAAVSLSVTHSGSVPVAYQWRKNGVTIPGATSATYSIASPQTTDTGSYDVVIANGYGPIVTNPVTLTVTPVVNNAVTITTQPADVSVSAGASASFSVVATGVGTLSYQWRKNGAPITGAISATYSLGAAQSGDAGVYSVVVTSMSGGSATSGNATLTVGGGTTPTPTTAPVITSQPVAQSVFSGVTATFRVVATGNPVPTYQWRRAGQPIPGANSATLTLPNVQPGDAANYDVMVSNAVNNVLSSTAALSLQTPPASGQGNWSTLAGSPGGAGSVDGPAADARLTAAVGVAVDRVSGVVYVSDNHTIRKLATDGLVSTLAGVAGLTGRTDGKGSVARFSNPSGLAVSPDGNLFVADSGNHSIRKVTSDGTVTLFAGSNAGLSGSSDGTGTDARFFTPNALAFDAFGNLFVSDSGNLTIRKITAQGVVSTFAGSAGNSGTNDGIGAAARFADLLAICVDSQNNLFVLCDAKIRKVTSAGVVTTEASVYKPAGIAVDGSGNLLYTTRDNPLKKIVPGGTAQTFAGSGVSGSEDGIGSDARFWSPKHCAVDGSGNLLVVDSGNNLLRKVTSGGVVTTVLGTGCLGNTDGTGFAARFRLPNAVASDAAGNLYVADTGNHTIRKVTSTGVVSTVAGTPAVSGNTDGPAQAALFHNPTGIAVDSLGAVYVADSGNHRIRKISGGQVVAFAGVAAGTAGFVNSSAALSRFDRPQGLVFDAAGNLLVADTDNHAIRKIAPDGTTSTFAGGTSGLADGTGTGAQFTLPEELAFDGAGNLFVSQATYVDTIRKITSGGVVTTPTFTAKRIGGVAFGTDGALYVSDPDSLQTVWKMLPDGTSSRFTTGGAGSTDGPGAVAKFNWPAGMVRRADGALVLVDSRNGRIRVCTLVDTPVSITGSPSSASVASGAAVNFSVLATGSQPFTYQWRKNGINLVGATSGTYSITFAQPSDAGSYDVVVANALGAVVSDAGVLSVSGAAAVTIGTQPASQTVVAGAAVSLGVSATGTGTLSYQWRRGGVPISGATGVTFSIASAQSSDAGSYDVLVTSSAGGSLTSSTATLTVSPAGPPGAPAILGQPVSLTVPEGNSAEFTVTATGTAPMRYQWRKNGTPIAGANYFKYKILSVQAVDTGMYDVVLSNPVGNATSTAATLSLLPPSNSAPAITEQPSAVAVYPGVAATFRVGVTGFPAPTFQWRKGGTPIAGATAASYTIASAGAGDAASYDVVVSNGLGTVTSSAAALTLKSIVPQKGKWNVLAGGTGGPGYADGTGSAARFDEPNGLACDSQGNLFVAGSGDRTIRKITPAGVVSTFAGTPYDIYSNPRAVAFDPAGTLYAALLTVNKGWGLAKFDAAGARTNVVTPSRDGTGFGSVAIDSTGTIYCVEGQAIWKVTTSGAASIFAGSLTTSGTVDGTGTAARFQQIRHLAVDSKNNVYVAGERIRVITPDGIVSTLPGGYEYAFAVAVDASGNVWTASVRCVQKITPTGQVTTVAGDNETEGSADGPGATASFSRLNGITIDRSGNIFVSDSGANCTIRKITPEGTVSTLAGLSPIGSADGHGTDARFFKPRKIAVDAAGNAYVTDQGNCTIRKITPGGTVTTVAGAPRVRASTDGLGSAARFSWPEAIAVDQANCLYVTEEAPNNIRKILPSGAVSTLATGAANQFGRMTGIDVDSSGTIFVSDYSKSVIRKITPAGQASIFAGSGKMESVDGIGTAAAFSRPGGLRRTKEGALLVGSQYQNIAGLEPEESNCKLRQILPSGAVSTLVTLPNLGVSMHVFDIGILPEGDLLLALPTRLYEATADGNFTFSTYYPNGSAMTGMAVDSNGNLLFADLDGCKVWISTLADVPINITAQPATASVLRGVPVTFSVGVTGSGPISYQWRRNGVEIPGATASSLALAESRASDAGVYDVVLSNGAGVVVSDAASLSLSTTAVIPVTITNPPRDVMVNLSSTLDLSVTATGSAPLTYQWRKDGVEIPSATGSSYRIPAVILSSGGYYDVVVSNAAGSVLSDPALVEINGMGNVPPSIRTQPVSLQGVAGGFSTFTVAVAGSAPLSYQWRKGGTPIAGATGASLTLNGLRATDAGIYDVVVSNRAGSVASAPAVLTVANPLTIVSQPAPLTVAAGNYAFLSVSASGTAPITYQWRKDGQPLAGGTASFYAVSAAQASDAGVYDVVVGNPGNSLTSSPAALNVQAGGGGQIVLLAQPVHTGALAGGAASFAVSASGTAPISYQWRRNGVQIAGATGPVYTVGAVQVSNVGSYDVVVGNWSGEVVSAKATLGLYTPVGITSQPLATSVATGNPATFAVGATGTAPLGYQWRKDGQNIAGATQATYAIGAAQAADVGSYDVVVTNPAGSALSSAASLGVGAPPVLVKGPVGGSVLAGGTIALSVSATGDGVTYQWRKNGLNISGATGSVLTLRRAVASDAGRFDVVVANPYGVVAPAPAAEVAVHVPVTFTKQPLSTLLREGASTTLSAQAAGSAPLSYQWRRDGVPIPGATQFSYTVANASTANAGAYDVVVTNPAGAVASSVAEVGVSVALGIVRQPSGASVTQGAAVHLSVLAKGSGEISYKWYKWPSTGNGTVVGTLSTLRFPSATPAQAGTYSVLVTGNGTPIFSDRVVVAVSTARGITVLRQPEDASIAEGAAASVALGIDGGGGEVQQTRYTLCVLQGGVPVATGVAGVVPETGVLEVPLRQVKASGAYVVQFDRVYNDGGAATARTQPFYVTVRGKSEVVGTYEGLLLDANPEGVLPDGAVARGWLTLSVSRTGSVSGRVQYVEAGSLAGAPEAALRTYQPVSRSFSGALVASAEDPLKLVVQLRLGVGTQAGRGALTVVLDQSSDTPELTATLTDTVSLPSPSVCVSTAAGLRRTLVATGTLPAAYAAVAGRYTLSAPAAVSATGDNNGQFLVQVLASGRALWTSRLTGYSGSGSSGLTAPAPALLVAPLYEGRSTVGATLLSTSALLGELRWVQGLDGGWDLALSGDRLEHARTKVSGSRVSGGFVGAYSATEFAAGTHLTGVRVLDFGGAADCRINGTLLGTLFAAGAPGLTFVSADPLGGGSLGFSWNVTVSSAGVVRTTGIAAGGVTPPVLSLRLDKTRGEWSGSYVSGGVRRSLIGCVLDLPASRGRGWFESGTAAGRWELRLGQ